MEKQLFLEIQNWEGEEDDRREHSWVQLGFFLSEQSRYHLSHPLTRVPPETLNKKNNKIGQ